MPGTRPSSRSLLPDLRPAAGSVRRRRGQRPGQSSQTMPARRSGSIFPVGQGARATPVGDGGDNTYRSLRQAPAAGVLHYLWEAADLTKWRSAYGRRRSWWIVHRELQGVAAGPRHRRPEQWRIPCSFRLSTPSRTRTGLAHDISGSCTGFCRRASRFRSASWSRNSKVSNRPNTGGSSPSSI